MQKVIPVAKDSPEARKLCSTCGFYGVQGTSEILCVHPDNISNKIDVVTGRPVYWFTAHEMREAEHAGFCGIEGKFWISREDRYRQVAAETAPRNTRSKTINIDDI